MPTDIPTETQIKMPTLTPTLTPTNDPTTAPTEDPSASSTVTPSYIPTLIPTLTYTTENVIFPIYLPWFITGGTVLLCSILICALIICFIVWHKQKHKSQENINDSVVVNTISDNSNINKHRNIRDCESMESMYNSNLRISPKTKGKANYNGQIQDITQQPGEDSLSSQNLKNEGIILNRIANNDLLLPYSDDIEIITDVNKTTIRSDV